jgi:hypothetical protein
MLLLLVLRPHLEDHWPVRGTQEDVLKEAVLKHI